MIDWRKHQETTAELFRSLGCSAEVDKLVVGARAKHKIDVWVVFSRFGFQNKWAIECKHWNSNVPKEKVLALRSIVEDVGADRGFIISKSGFQSGAIRAAAYTNITLTSIEDLKQIVSGKLAQSALYRLETSATRLGHEIQSLYKVERPTANSFTSSLLPGVDGGAVKWASGTLFALGIGFDSIRLAEPPYAVSFDEEGNRIVAVPSIESFVENASVLIRDIEKIVELQMENAGKKRGE